MQIHRLLPPCPIQSEISAISLYEGLVRVPPLSNTLILAALNAVRDTGQRSVLTDVCQNDEAVVSIVGGVEGEVDPRGGWKGCRHCSR